jgi:hypothetical protein
MAAGRPATTTPRAAPRGRSDHPAGEEGGCRPETRGDRGILLVARSAAAAAEEPDEPADQRHAGRDAGREAKAGDEQAAFPDVPEAGREAE